MKAQRMSTQDEMSQHVIGQDLMGQGLIGKALTRRQCVLGVGLGVVTTAGLVPWVSLGAAQAQAEPVRLWRPVDPLALQGRGRVQPHAEQQAQTQALWQAWHVLHQA